MAPLGVPQVRASGGAFSRPAGRPAARRTTQRTRASPASTLLSRSPRPSDVSSSPVLTAALPPLDGPAAQARAALRDALAAAGDTFSASADLPLPLPPSAEECLLALGTQLRLAERLAPSLAACPAERRAAAVEGVYADALAVARLWAGATAGVVGEAADGTGDAPCCSPGSRCTVQVKLLRETMCSKLHVDHVAARALCSLLGAGTEWVAEPTAPLPALASFAVRGGGSSAGDALKALCLEAQPLAAAGERDVVMLRGTRWPRRRARAPLHRSPDVQLSDFRLIVKVDEGICGETLSTVTDVPPASEEEDVLQPVDYKY